MTAVTSRPMRWVRAHGASAFVLVLGLTLTVFAYRFTLRGARETDERRFDEQVTSINSGITRRVDTYLAALVGTRGLFSAGGEIGRTEFARYVQNYGIEQRYPGIQGIGFTRSLAREEVPAFEQQVRADGFPDFKVWPRSSRPTASAVVFLEPFDERNRRAFGYDMSAEPIRREAMERARDTGEPAASGKVFLVQEYAGNAQPGFNVYLPVYSTPQPADVEARRRTLVGWVYAPFRMGDLVSGVFQDGLPLLVDFAIYDGLQPSPGGLLFTTQQGVAGTVSSRPHLRRTVVDIAGRPWTIEFRSRAPFDRDSPAHVPNLVLLGGLTMTALLFAVTRAQGRARAVAEEERERSAFLASAGTLLARSLDYATTLANLAQLSVPTLADGCSVELRDEGGEVRNVALVHRDPERVHAVREIRAGYPPNPNAASGIAHVLRTGESQFVPNVTDEMMRAVAVDERHLALLRKADVRSMMSVPLLARGQVLGAITFAADASRRRFTHTELELAEELARLASAAVDNARLYQRAQDAIRLRDDFLSVAAHELRTPLTSLHLKLQMLHRRATPHGPQLVEAVAAVDRQVARLTRLVESVLDLSRIATGRLHLHLERVDLSALVSEVVARSAEEAAAARTQVAVAAEPSLIGMWDPVRLEQVVTNLLSNALKYGAGRPVHVTVSAAGGRARVVVRDQGIGIEPEALDRIFGRFERSVSVRHYGGLGLGLYIVRQTVEAMGGTVTVESEPGNGATFTVELPQQPAAPAIAEASSPSAPAPPAGEVSPTEQRSG